MQGGGHVLYVLKLLNFVRCPWILVSGPGALQKRAGTCLHASGKVFAWNLHMEMDKTVVQSIRPEHLRIFHHFGKFFCQPFGEDTFSRNAPKTKFKPHIVIALNLSDFCARMKFGTHVLKPC